MDWQHILSYITGSVEEELRLRNEYLAAENRILRSKIPGRVPLDDSDRAILAQIGKRLRLKALRNLATIVKPETVLAWHRKLIAKKFDGSANRKPGRPRVSTTWRATSRHLSRRTLSSTPRPTKSPTTGPTVLRTRIQVKSRA